MRIKSIVLLPLLAVILGLFLLYLHNHPDPVFPTKGDRPFRSLPRAQIRKFIINQPLFRDYNPSEMPELEGDKPGELTVRTAEDAKMLRRQLEFEQLKDGRLRQREPHDQRSDQALLQPVLDQILDMAIYDRVEWKPESMGFDPGHVVRVLLVTAEKNYRVDFGTTSPDGAMIYFKLPDAPFAYLTPVGALSALRLPEEKFLDHNLFSVPPSAVQRFVIDAWDKDEQTLHLDCVKIEAQDEQGRPATAWKLADRPTAAVRQEDLRNLRLALMSLRATNRQWKLRYDELPNEFKFPIPWPSALNLHPKIDRLRLSILHTPGADNEEGEIERYEMIRVEVSPLLVMAQTGLPPERQDPAKRTFWVARHSSGLSPLEEATRQAEQQAANPDEPAAEAFEAEWISFTRSAIDPVIGLARRIDAGTQIPTPGAPAQPSFMPGAQAP